MAKGKRKVPDINSSSTADIAFLLLIFFLITTSMDTDRGLARRLPPPPENIEKPDDQKVKQRNVLQIYLNMYDQLMVNGEIMNVQQLRAKTKEFIANKYNDESLPERVSKDVNFFGPMMITEKHVVSLQNDRSSSYQAYIDVQNELVAAYNELRDELSQEKWGKKYSELDDEQQKAVREVYPQKISEAEPKKYGEVTLKVEFKIPQATELEKLEKKSLVTFVYVGKPMREFRQKMGSESRIQLNDAFAEVSEIQDYIIAERSSMKESDQAMMTVSLKIDKDTKMGIVTDIKNALRQAYALKINYSSQYRE